MSFIVFTVAESEVKVFNTLIESKWTRRCILHDDSVISCSCNWRGNVVER